jgi:ankyrin repeat protein
MLSKLETAKHVSRFILIKTIEEGKWDEAASIIYNDETYAQIQDKHQNYPIHLTTRYGGTSRLLELLINAFPDGLKIRDADGNLPIHLAVSHHKGKLWIDINELSVMIFEAYPKCIRDVDKKGYLPVHLALRSKGPDEMIKYLLQIYPDSVAIPDPRGNTCLHLAIQFEGSFFLIHQILQLYPDAISIPNSNGALPIHKAAFFNAPIDVLEMILNRNPSLASKPDTNGNLPLHLACLNAGGPPNEAKLRLWLAAFPAALSIPNKKGIVPLMMFQRPQDHNIEDYL